jgi:NADH-quinone oxidoreductase subunit N
VFIGKLEIFTAAIDGGYTWLAVLAVANTVASVFYYLRWLVPAFSRPADSAPAPVPGEPDPLRAAGRWPAVAAYTGGVISVTLGVTAGAILPLLGGGVL